MNKHNINARQIKAARALVDWSQDELAEASGLSVATIRKLESGHISPRSSTTEAIQKAFEDGGLEFIEPSGVRQRPEEITVYEGHQGFVDFFNEVYKSAATKGGEFVCVAESERRYGEVLKDYDKIYAANMSQIVTPFTFHCILTEDTDDVEMGVPYCDYRIISKHYVDSVSFYIYEDKYAIFLFDAMPEPRIIVVQSQQVADAFRRQFYSMWDKATPVIAQ